MSDSIKNSNYFGIDVEGNLVPSSIGTGGDFFVVDAESDISSTASPISHTYFELDEFGDIIPKQASANFDDYTDLITPLYKNKPKYMSLVNMYLSNILSPELISPMIENAFDIERAIGAQLDIIGNEVGCSRHITFTPLDGSGDILSDYYFRIIIKCAIIRNLWKGDIMTIETLWDILFTDISMRIKDNQDMTMSIYFSGKISSLLQELINHGYVIPKPQAVRINEIIYANTKPEFGYDLSTADVDGYDVGNWHINTD